MNVLDTIYVFVPDISVFKDAFNLIQDTNLKKSAREFLNFLAIQSEESGGFKFLRTPIEFTVKLMNDPLFDETEIWSLLGLILRVEPVFDKDIASEKEIVKCFEYLNIYKKPILVSNDIKEEYQQIGSLTTTQIMKLIPTMMCDRSLIDKNN